MKAVSIICSLCLLLIGLNSCKKYPENTLWFKNPEKMTFIFGELTVYKVNGIDSLPFLESYGLHGSQILLNDIRMYPTCNYCNNGYSFSFSGLVYNGAHNFSLSSGSFEYVSKGKKIKIYNQPERLYYSKNIFIESGLEWEIVYLSKKDDKRKIKTTYNGNVYEIQFN